jgi:hypothetical protein
LRILMLAAVVVVTARVDAASQTFVELGAAAGRACLMAEASCSEANAAVGFQLGVWHRDKAAFRLRFIEVAPPDRRDRFGAYTVRSFDQTRQLWLGELTFHFGSHHIVRPFAGFAIGARRDRIRITCEPVPCDEIPRTIVVVGPDDGDYRVHQSVGGAAGLAIVPTRRIVIAAQITIQDFFGEHAGTNAVLLQAGYRFPVGRR